MPTLVQDPPHSNSSRRYPTRDNRSPFPTPPKVITTPAFAHADYTPLDHCSSSLSAIEKLENTIMTLNATADPENVSVQPTNLLFCLFLIKRPLRVIRVRDSRVKGGSVRVKVNQ